MNVRCWHRATRFAVLALLPSCVAAPADRVPRVVEPVCQVPVEEGAPTPGILTRVPLTLAAGCNAVWQTASDEIVYALRADGSVDETNLYLEQHMAAFVDDEGLCVLRVDTYAWERKLDDLLELAPIAVRATVCGARVTTSSASALAAMTPPLSPQLVGVDVGYEPDAGAPVLTAVVLPSSPLALAIEDGAAPMACGDEGDVSAFIDEYAFRHRVVVQMKKEEALRLAWDGALEVSYEVQYR